MNKLSENTSKHRKCRICKNVKELSSLNFHFEKSRAFGFSYVCIVCEKERAKKKYEKNPRKGRYKMLTTEQKKHRLVIAKNYRKTNYGRALYMLKSYIAIDLKKSRVCDITIDFLINSIFNKPCVYCGDTFNVGCDRINNDIGHIMENVVPCCKDCNTGRMNNFTHEEMLFIGKSIAKVKEWRKLRDLPHFEI